MNKPANLSHAIDRSLRGEETASIAVGGHRFSLPTLAVIKEPDQIIIGTEQGSAIHHLGWIRTLAPIVFHATVDQHGSLTQLNVSNKDIEQKIAPLRRQIEAVIDLPAILDPSETQILERGLKLQALLDQGQLGSASFLVASCVSFAARRYLGREWSITSFQHENPICLRPTARGPAQRPFRSGAVA